jgi:hypothetical protein
MLLRSVTIAAVLSVASTAIAQQPATADSASPDGQMVNSNMPADAWPHPELSPDSHWAKEMVLVILLGFFLPAAIIGPLLRRSIAAELPELHSQEEESAFTASQHEPGHTRSPG